MGKDKKVIRLRGKTLKVTCTEQSALDIVLPFVNMTAYVIGIEHPDEMPDSLSMQRNVAAAKLKIATIMANNMSRVVESKNLSFITVEVIPGGGYFRISLVETQVGVVRVVQGFKIILNGTAGLTLINKLASMHNGQDTSDDTHVKKVIKSLLDTGL